jgi:hypothetical protein
VTLLPVTRRGLPTAPLGYLAVGPLSGEVEHPAGASPSKCIIISHLDLASAGTSASSQFPLHGSFFACVSNITLVFTKLSSLISMSSGAGGAGLGFATSSCSLMDVTCSGVPAPSGSL